MDLEYSGSQEFENLSLDANGSASQASHPGTPFGYHEQQMLAEPEDVSA